MQQILYYYFNSKGKKHPLTTTLQYCTQYADQEKPTFLTPMNISTSLHSQEAIPIPCRAKERTATEQLFSKILNTQVPLHWDFFSSRFHGCSVPPVLRELGCPAALMGAQRPYKVRDRVPVREVDLCCSKAKVSAIFLNRQYSN